MDSVGKCVDHGGIHCLVHSRVLPPPIRHTIICVAGAKKAAAVAQALTQRVPAGQMPAQMVRPGCGDPGTRLVWLMGAEAASGLQAVGGSTPSMSA